MTPSDFLFPLLAMAIILAFVFLACYRATLSHRSAAPAQWQRVPKTAAPLSAGRGPAVPPLPAAPSGEGPAYDPEDVTGELFDSREDFVTLHWSQSQGKTTALAKSALKAQLKARIAAELNRQTI